MLTGTDKKTNKKTKKTQTPEKSHLSLAKGSGKGQTSNIKNF